MHRQGIGFSVHGVVVDRKTLSRIFFLVMGTVGKDATRVGITKGLLQGAAAQVRSVPSSSRCGRQHRWTWLLTSAP